MAREHVGLGEEIRRARLEAGWSQFDLAKKVGIAPSELSKYETGAYEPSLPNYFRLCKVFGWPLPEWWSATGTDDGFSSRWSTYTPSDLEVLWVRGLEDVREVQSAIR